MKPSALDVLVCPACKAALDVHAAAAEGREILEGTLTCSSCQARVPDSRRRAPVRARRLVREQLRPPVELVPHRAARFLKPATSRSEEALRRRTGWRDDEYRGRRLLDAGVGAGRFAERAASKGAEVFGIDLTTAVDAAYRNIGEREGVHLIQADIFALPFRLGDVRSRVLDRRPSSHARSRGGVPACGRDASSRTAGSRCISTAATASSHRMSDAIRRVTTRLPLGVMWALSAAAVPLYYLYRLPVVGKIAHLALPISMEPHWRWRWLDTFDWYAPKYQFKYLYPEIYRWYQRRRVRRRGDLRRVRSACPDKNDAASGDERWPRALAQSGGVLKSRPRQPSRAPAAGRVAFGGLVFFTVVLLLSPQTFFPVLKTVRIALVAAGVGDRGARDRRDGPAGADHAVRTARRRLRVALLGWAVLTIPFSSGPAAAWRC